MGERWEKDEEIRGNPHQGRTEVQYCGTLRIKDYATLNLVIYSDQERGTIKLSNFIFNTTNLIEYPIQYS